MKCPQCQATMTEGFLYVRGFGSSLGWSERGDVRSFSRKGIERLDLTALSLTPTGAQAVINSPRCRGCGLLVLPTGAGT